MDSLDKFKETKLQHIDKFHSKLKGEGISEEDYQFVHKLWKKFNLQDIGDLHDLYLETDVMLLADVFETFRRTIKKQYNLDPAHFITAPGLS